MHARLATPFCRFPLPASLLLLLGLAGVAEPGIAGTGRLLSQWMTQAPTIDGQISVGEWDQAWSDLLGNGISIRIGNDARTLYLGIYDFNNPSFGPGDAVFLHFDDEGGVAPILDDSAWANSGCQIAPNLGEGVVIFDSDQSIRYQEWVAPFTGCSPLAIPGRISYRSSSLDGLSYEVAIPLDGPAPLRVGPGNRFGIRVQVNRDGTTVACLPACAGSDPANFRNLVLASGGCNTGPQDFGSGDPKIGLPLDWTSQVFGGGESWQQSLPPFYGDPVFCDANDTGGTGAAACVANFFYTSPDTFARLYMPLSLAGQTSATVRVRALFVMDPNGMGEEDYLQIYLARLEGGGDELLFWDGQSQGGTVTLPFSLAGSPPVELQFLHSTDLAGGLEGGFAQIDDVELLCGPFLFADGFESGLTTHWSATAF